MSAHTQALAGALATMRQVAGDKKIYKRGEQTVLVTMVVGRTVSEDTDEYGTTIRVDQRDYLIAVADLVLGGQPATPQSGDTIVDGPRTYEVMLLAGKECFNFSDPDQTTFRVHTK